MQALDPRIIVLLLYYTRTVDNKLLTTVATEQVVHLLLDYIATYPHNAIVYWASNMIFCAHANTGFLSESNSCSRAGVHNFLLEDDPLPRFNGAVLSIAKIIKFIMTSAAKSELAALLRNDTPPPNLH